MKLLNFIQNNEVKLGIELENGVLDVNKYKDLISDKTPRTMEEAIESGKESLEKLVKNLDDNVELIKIQDIKYAPVITNPEKILCVGLNYKSHREETKTTFKKEDDYPVLFSKFKNALAANLEDIPLIEEDVKYDYEAEMVIVIGKEGKNIEKEKVSDYIFGYTVGNDISARTLQRRSGQWLIGKSIDKFAPVGPVIVTADVINASNLDIKCEVNGKVVQDSNTKNLIYDIETIVSYASKFMTLKPGDIIFTGTPGGVILGMPEEKQVWLKPGDKMSVTIENIGTLINTLK
ncbi:MAG: fumarylacetoacetate hydrolase family protein [Clostridium perfringens]|nr:fumarylacetoacetate hydrolase family protein [Clostridium perfringens]